MVGKKIAFALALPFALAGCFTIHETEYPETVMSAAPAGTDVKVALEDFQLVYSVLDVIHTSETHLVDGGYGRHGHYRGTRFATVNSDTYIPATRITGAFRSRAETLLMRSPQAQYVVSGEFAGPYTPSGADWRRAAVALGSCLLASYNATGYRLTVRVHEISSGKALLSRDYIQEYSASGFSPLGPIGMCGFTKTDDEVMRAWCCNALVDRAMADVSALLSSVASAASAQNAQKGEEKGK